jgi:hypothetical protein
VALCLPGALAAQRNGGTLMATATVMAPPAAVRALAPERGGAALEGTAGAWRLSGRPGAPVGVSFIVPETLAPALARGGSPLPLVRRSATAQWQRPGDAIATRFDARSGATALLGTADDPSVRLALAWTPRPAAPAPWGQYLGTVVMTLVYY